MIIDQLLKFAPTTQALSGAGSVASTDTIDLSQERRIGTSEDMAVVITCSTALAGTSPTLQVNIQSDDNTGFSTPAVVASSPTLTAFAAGAKLIIPIPAGVATERYMRLNYTLGGTSPTCTVQAFLQPVKGIENFAAYDDNIVIS